MSDYNRQEQLRQLHQQRRTLTEQKAGDAIDHLLKLQCPVNFKKVSEQSGISVATLYRHENIKQRIVALRDRALKPISVKATTVDMSNTGKDAIIASLKRRIKKLERENVRLRNQLKGYTSKVWETI